MKNINLSKYESNSITSAKTDTIGIDDIKARKVFDNFRIIYMIIKTNFFFSKQSSRYILHIVI
jgi:hypothetical protein